jgi:riboflavin synthase
VFTGLVEAIGVLRRREGRPVARLRFDVGAGAAFEAPLVLGESIAVNGVCLTVDAIVAGGFEADASEETLHKTTLGRVSIGGRVHLERATPLGGRMGGHVVLGHVDCVGSVVGLEMRGDARRLSVRVDETIAAYVAPKGSITLDGVSLTVNGVRDGEGCVLDVMLVPHTIGRTLLGDLRPSASVNVEADVLARYVARQLAVAGVTSSSDSLDTHGSGGRGTDDDPDQRILEKLRTGGWV